jgi:hypothetical protein
MSTRREKKKKTYRRRRLKVLALRQAVRRKVAVQDTVCVVENLSGAKRGEDCVFEDKSAQLDGGRSNGNEPRAVRTVRRSMLVESVGEVLERRKSEGNKRKAGIGSREE